MAFEVQLLNQKESQRVGTFLEIRQDVWICSKPDYFHCVLQIWALNEITFFSISLLCLS